MPKKTKLESAKKKGVEHHFYGFSTGKLLTKKRFLDFLDLLDQIKANKKNTLIHCHAGADRTGLMASIIQIYLYDFSYKDAFDSSFNSYYGHIRYKNTPVEKVLSDYAKYEKEMGFREWLEKHYKLKNYTKSKNRISVSSFLNYSSKQINKRFMQLYHAL